MSDARRILELIIDEYSVEKFGRFFREKSQQFALRQEAYSRYDDDDFTNGLKIGEINFSEIDSLLVCVFEVTKALSERTGKKAQYEKAKSVLKSIENQRYSAGIFIFYDQTGNFRFSLVYPESIGTRRQWNHFRRFTYFVSDEYTNKTFKSRIGDGDFSSLEKIKEAFSVEKVTQDFYKGIAYWYFWACKASDLPEGAEKQENRKEMFIIRLITRIIFVWFMRQKDALVPDILFDKQRLAEILKDLSPESMSYYRAILQNLFFATLSTEIKNRKFRSELRAKSGWNEDFGNQYVYRYYDLFQNPEMIESYFKEIPFLNGGLFECLDNKDKDEYIDGFTERKKYQPNIPNYLFFGDERKVDLNKDFGTKNKIYKARGLIDILSSFNFTMDENTPDDQDVALDPELLGRVFENLLASFNPETSTTARKATGSYYTPREIVDYMVTESLKEYFKTHLANVQDIDKKLETLFAVGNDENPFTKTESRKLVELIESVRIVDPAVGSGAFPMGTLNKMVFILNKVDPENELWKQAQLEATEAIPDPQVRRNTKKQIEEFFKDKNADYGRKLYLIQKCIYGVDIQQIAVEIAKLRFFISLLVDEKIDKGKENWGVEPLPNLDFKIMQGNSLISEFLGIDFDNGQAKQEQIGMFFAEEETNLIKEFEQKKIDFQNESDKDKKAKLKSEVEDLMIMIFETKVRKQKADYFRQMDEIGKKYAILPNKKTREEIIAKEKQELSQKTGFDLENIEKQLREFTSKNKTKPFFAWKLYFAEVFEKGGFDVVIANPPYVRQEKIKDQKPLLQSYELYNSTSDLYVYFYERSYKLLKSRGILTFISSNKWMRAQYGEKLRHFFKENTKTLQLIDFNGHKVFEATVDTNIIILQKEIPSTDYRVPFVNIQSDFTGENLSQYLSEHQQSIPLNHLNNNGWTFVDEKTLKLKQKIEAVGTPLKDWDVKIYRGIITGFNQAFIVYTPTKERLCEEDPKSAEILKPILRGRDIGRYYYDWEGLWLIKIESGRTDKERGNENPKNFFKQKYPAIYNHLTVFKGQFGKGKGLLNRDDQGRYWWELRDCDYYQEFEKEKIVWPVIGKESTFVYDDQGFYHNDKAFSLVGADTKYLLSVLNSSLAYWYLLQIGSKLGLEGFEFRKIYVERTPIKKISKDEQKPFIDLVDKILAITKGDDYLKNLAKQAKVREYEKQIDQLVYKLYELTPEEISVVEGKNEN